MYRRNLLYRALFGRYLLACPYNGRQAMSGSIFISYRQADSRHATGRLYEHLAKNFHHSRLFMDIDSVEPGVDFLRVIDERISHCRVLLAVIGPNWSTVCDDDGSMKEAGVVGPPKIHVVA